MSYADWSREEFECSDQIEPDDRPTLADLIDGCDDDEEDNDD